MNSEGEKHVARILSVLEEMPSTSHEIADETGISNGQCRVLISSLKRDGVIEVSGYVLRDFVVQRSVAMYRIRRTA